MKGKDYKHYVHQLFCELKRLGVYNQYMHYRMNGRIKRKLIRDGSTYHVLEVTFSDVTYENATHEEVIMSLEDAAKYFASVRGYHPHMPLLWNFASYLVSFSWTETDEGYYFWHDIYEKLKKRECKYSLMGS